MRRPPLLTWAVATFTAAARAAPESFGLFAYLREEIARGELWRLLTCHVIHGSPEHFAWDVAAFLALGWQAERRFARGYPVLLAGAALAVGAGLFLLRPGLGWYCGLSGVDTALYAALIAEEARDAWRRRDGTLLALDFLWAAGLAGKITYEYAAGSMLFARSSAIAPVFEAHLLGAGTGALLFLIYRPRPAGPTPALETI